jgi:hypothetical protein
MECPSIRRRVTPRGTAKIVIRAHRVRIAVQTFALVARLV